MIIKLVRVTDDYTEQGNNHLFTNGNQNYYVISETKLDPGKFYDVQIHKAQQIRMHRYYIEDINTIAIEITEGLEIIIDEALELLGHEEILKLPFNESIEKVNKIANALHESKAQCIKLRHYDLYKEAYEIFMNAVSNINQEERKRIIEIARKIEEES